ncbi:oxidoreductase [Dendryphion nanum]|uniref:Oxidoreductase n=1 Tax=Dendryphion nanum TaxID=256645 RepID=A0A9P9I9I9_9PLEO|nr:oxidoreductase [Dendryphion nanum]
MAFSNRRLSGSALVTGAGSGIGRAVSLSLAAAGISTLYITDLSNDGLSTTRSAIDALLLHTPPTIYVFPGDISVPSFTKTLFSQVHSLDYAVNCAGILGRASPTHELSIEDFDAINNVNYRGLWLCVKEEISLMLKNDLQIYANALSETEASTRAQRGAIVNISSQLAVVGKASSAAYTASKAAVLSLTRSDACDYSTPKHRIRINAICPGVIRTGMTSSGEGVVNKELEHSVLIAPMGRVGEPGEVADAAVWLCSGESSFVTGQGIVVDGGYVIN